MHKLNPATLTPAQADGIACIICAGEDGLMSPAGTVDGWQVFAHAGCLPPAEPVQVPLLEDGDEPEGTPDGPCALGWSHVGECVDRGTKVAEILAEIDHRVEVRRAEISAMVDAILAAV